jgi:diaminohydroxyphosphoribosylaminopyrimidine deaminase/5-amino-6-(5-phosphoribosylamino)uracil reductase
MRRALALAALASHISMPNPRVGCVLFKDGVMIGEGHTQPAGQDHAEVQALKDCAKRGLDPRGATAYVTLEPCSHFGRTPPCADALVRAGVARVVAAMLDPNPLVAGKGFARLQAAGISVLPGLYEPEARELNIGFVSRIERGRPWLRLKIAASLDGKTALANGQSKWITGREARADVQHWRARSCAMLTGIGTVLADDPQLTVRELDGQPWPHARQPLRIILDSHLQTPPHAKVLAVPGVLIVHADANDTARARALQVAGAELLALPGSDGRVDLVALLPLLGQRQINEVTVEAGACLNGALLQAGVVDEVVLYQAPLLLGDAARGMAGFALDDLSRARRFVVQDQRAVGADWRRVLR